MTERRRGVVQGLLASIDRLGMVGNWVSVLGMWLLAAVVTFDVVTRAAGAPTEWGVEVSVYLMLAVAFIGAGPTQAVDGHFRVSLVRDRLGRRGRRVADVIALLASLVFVILFTIGAWRLASFSWMLSLETSTRLSIPMWLLQGIMVAGGAFLSLAILADLIRLLRDGTTGREHRAGAGEVI